MPEVRVRNAPVCLEKGTGWRVVIGRLESIHHEVIYDTFLEELFYPWLQIRIIFM